MALTVQPEAVVDLFANRQARGRGLIARFLKSAPADLLGRRVIDPPAVPRILVDTYAATLTRLIETPVPERPVVVELDSEARELFRAFCATVEPEMGEGGSLSNCTEWAGKLPGAIARIALSLYGLTWGVTGHTPQRIDGETMAAALAWSPYLIDQERIVSGVVGVDPTVVTAGRLLDWIGSHPPEPGQPDTFSRRDAFCGVRCEHVQRAADIDLSLALLEDLGYIVPQATAERSGPGRKPSERFLINPKWRAQQ